MEWTPTSIDVREAIRRVVQPPLAGPEQRLGEGIVMVDAWPTVRRRLAVEDLEAQDLAAIEINDQVQVIEQGAGVTVW